MKEAFLQILVVNLGTYSVTVDVVGVKSLFSAEGERGVVLITL